MSFFISLFSNLRLVFSNYKYILLFLFLNILILFFFYSQTADELIKVNYGQTYYTIMWALQYSIAIFFSLFITLSIFKIFYFSSSSVKEGTTGGLGSILGVLVAGCPACSLTIATYLGLAGFISFLPYDGLELKALSLILLLGVNYYILKNLQLCSIKKKKFKL